MTWLSEGPVHLPHLLVHLGDAQPETGERAALGGSPTPRPPRILPPPHSQGHDVGVGVVHGDADGVLLALVFGVVVGASLQEEADEAAAEEGSCVHLLPQWNFHFLLVFLTVVFMVFPSSLNNVKL